MLKKRFPESSCTSFEFQSLARKYLGNDGHLGRRRGPHVAVQWTPACAGGGIQRARVRASKQTKCLCRPRPPKAPLRRERPITEFSHKRRSQPRSNVTATLAHYRDAPSAKKNGTLSMTRDEVFHLFGARRLATAFASRVCSTCCRKQASGEGKRQQAGALQSGFHVPPTTSASCCAAYCTCSSVISGKNGMLKTRSQARSA